MRSIITYYGGKGSSWRRIVPYFPKHQTFVDVFGGAANILINKTPAPVEVYNDINSEVVTLFRVLRDKPDELQRKLQLTPYAREEFVRSLESMDGLDDVEKARRIMVKYRMCFGGKGGQATAGRWSYSVSQSSRGMPGNVSGWISVVDDVLPQVAARLRGVQIENGCFSDIIPRYDTVDTLFYCDPPYMMGTRNGGKGYADEMTDEQHRRLAELLNDASGMVVLSGYDSPEYNRWYAGWKRVEFDVAANTHTRQTGGTKSRRTEVLWIKPAA